MIWEIILVGIEKRHIDGRSLPEGLLIYTVEIEGRIIQTGKVVKQR